MEDTLIFFLSDNGSSAEIMVRGDGHDHSASMGSASTFLCLGPGWSSVGNTPFRKHKVWVHEGGCATPLIVHWPAGITNSGWRHQVGHVIDLVPTMLEAAGIGRESVKQDGAPEFPGQSLVDSFNLDTTVDREIWYCHSGNRAIRVGDWKLVAAKAGEWELFNLNGDRAETINRASEFPEKVKVMAALWRKRAEQFVKDAGN